MLKAGALFYAIAISLLIALVSSSFILFSHYNRINHLVMEKQFQLNLNAQSGLNMLLSKNSAIAYNEVQYIDLFGDETDSVQLERKSWGLFDIAISRAFFKNQESLQMAFTGEYYDSTNLDALYLADYERPLSLCGNTVITGTSYLPKSGIKRAYIEGQNFAGINFTNGKVLESRASLPEINEDIIKHNSNYLHFKYPKNDSLMFFSDLTVDTLTRSFKQSTLVINSKNAVVLINKHLKGNVRIVSEKSVFVGASSNLTDVVVYAPEITVEKGFKGSVQLIASDSIKLGDNCELTYPSSVALIGDAKKLQPSGLIEIGEQSSIGGVVFTYQKNSEGVPAMKVLMGKDSKVIGQAYVAGSIDLKGSVFGNLTCNKFILKTPSSYYENHLLNAVIDISKRPKGYVSAGIFNKVSRFEVAKWLNY